MNPVFTYILSACLLFVCMGNIHVIQAQGNVQTKEISQYFATGNASGLSSLLNVQLDVIIAQDEASYAKAQVSNKIQTFFSHHRPTNFIVKHEGTAPDGSQFIEGSLSTSTGTFRTYVLLKNGKIYELTIE